MRTIRVFGDLAKRLGQRIFVADVASAAEAVRFLVSNFPWLQTYMQDRYYRVFASTCSLGEDNLHDPVSRHEDILICPVVTGSGGSITNIIVGGLLIVASFFTFGVPLLLGVTLGGLLFSVGVALVLGGVAQLLAPQTDTSQVDVEEIESYNFSGLQNTSRQGVAVPVCYGEVVTGSVVISAGVSVQDLDPNGGSANSLDGKFSGVMT